MRSEVDPTAAPAPYTDVRKIILQGDSGMEFHGYSVDEFKEIMLFMRDLNTNPDAMMSTFSRGRP